MALPTVADLKIHANIPAAVTDQDDELGDYLDAAVEMVEAIVGPLEAGEITETHHKWAPGVIVLKRMPVAEVLTVTSVFGADDSVPVALDDLEIDLTTGIIRGTVGRGFLGTTVVTYSTGRDTLPASIKLAVLIVAAHLFETQRVPMQNEDAAPVGFGGGIDAAMPTARGYALPNRALELLRPYTTVSFA